jgi:mono/diheme cytochrome c family protein
MTRIAKAHVMVFSLAFAVAACATPAQRQMESGVVASVNPDFRLDEQKAEVGHDLWGARGCMGCHSIGHGRLAGPDLFGVTERRTIDWLKSFLKDTDAMLQTDPIAQALLQEFGGARMPNIKMTDQEIEAIIHYMQRKTNDRRAGKN